MSSTFVLLRSTTFNRSAKFWKIRHRFCDVDIIVAGNQRLPAHKIVLATASNFFIELLEESDEIDLSEFDLSVIEHILEFVYTGKTKVPVENEPLLYECAEKLKLEGLPMRFNKMSVPRAEKITDLPTEILIKIFNRCSTKDLMKNVSLVSKQMNVLSKDPSVGISVRFNEDTQPERAKHIFENMSSRIASLILSSGTREENQEILQMLIDQISLLSRLDRLIIYKSEKVITKKFLTQLSHLNRLRFLYLESRFEEFSFSKIAECSKLKSLHLKFKYSYSLTQDDFKVLENLGKRTELHLDFIDCDLARLPIVSSAEFPVNTRNDNLRHRLDIRIDSVFALDAVLSHLPHIHVLVVYGKCELDDQEKIQTLYALVSRSKNLFHLILKCSRVDETLFKNQFKGWNYYYNYYEGKCELRLFT